MILPVSCALLATTAVLLNMPPLTQCHLETPIAPEQHWFRARRVVVQPWLGSHHVYGLFDIPQQYKRDRLYRAKLMIQEFSKGFVETTPEGEDLSDDGIQAGFYVKRAYLPTRIALWFLVTGRFGDLQTSCHWWLVMVDRIH